ncbi:MAG TPA: type III-B CRISPR module-associated Cmr3 family protein [Xanthobacteraceae bacterium]|jgi:CRISPR-associated protein Cmr3
MTSVFIEPQDVLALRGNKLFGEPGSYGESLVPPWPSVAAGAIRSMMLARDGNAAAFARSETRHPALGTPDEPGPFTLTAFHLARKQHNCIEPLFAPPADTVIDAPEGKLEIRRLRPIVPADGLSSSKPLPLLPVLAQANRSKPRTGYWLTAAGWRAYLDDVAIGPDHLVASESLWKYDLRVGIGLSARTRHVEEGKLFSVNTVALKPGNGFVARVLGAELPSDGMLRFGGDGRSARMRAVEIDWPLPDFDFIARTRRARLVLTSPGLFDRGWLPTGMSSSDDRTYRFSLHGVRARLVCAALNRAEVISGFDLAKRRPKPALRAVPTGSVFWLDEIDAAPADLRKLAETGLWPAEHHNDARRAEGFNRITLALDRMREHHV